MCSTHGRTTMGFRRCPRAPSQNLLASGTSERQLVSELKQPAHSTIFLPRTTRKSHCSTNGDSGSLWYRCSYLIVRAGTSMTTNATRWHSLTRRPDCMILAQVEGEDHEPHNKRTQNRDHADDPTGGRVPAGQHLQHQKVERQGDTEVLPGRLSRR